MTPETVLAALGATAGLDNLRLHWDASMQAMPDGVPEFLTDVFWRRASRTCGFGDEVDPALSRAAAAIRNDPALRCLAWHAYWRIFICPEACPPNGWPELKTQLGDDVGLFHLLVGLAYVPLVQEKHRQWGIPESVTWETLGQVRSYCDDTYRRGHGGLPGIYPGQLSWLRHYTRERYFRLGRLEYWLGPNPYRLAVYRRRRDGCTVALAADGTRFAADGTIYRDAAEYRPGEGWTATLSQNADGVSGYPLHPDGHGLPQPVTLPAADWECALAHGDCCLMLHIPSGGRMTPEACRESLLTAMGFFPRHFPGDVPRAVVCTSWIFSPQLQRIFGPAANLSIFQRNLYLFPVASGPWDGLWFVFLQHGSLDLDAVPCETSLQRGLRDFLKQGNRWRMAGMFVLMEDLARFGSEPYRSDWAAGCPAAEDSAVSAPADQSPRESQP